MIPLEDDINAPRVGDVVCVPEGTHYRTITELVGWMDDGRFKVRTLDQRHGHTVSMALSWTPKAYVEPPPPKARPCKRNNCDCHGVVE